MSKSDEIKVTVVEFGDRPQYQLQWRDPLTGRKKTKTTEYRRDGGKQARKDAEKAAGKLQAELNEGRYQERRNTTWREFRERYETEVLPSLSDSTDQRVNTAFNLVESHLNPRMLRELTTEALSTWIAKISEGRADATVGIYCRHLRAALNWAVSMEFIDKAPKIRIPRGATQGKMKGRPIVLEEHERILAAVPKIIPPERVDGWRRFLNGLWWSGLRLGEALRLSGIPPRPSASSCSTVTIP